MTHDPTLAAPNREADKAAVCRGKEGFTSGAVAWRVMKRRKANHNRMRKDGHKAGKVYRCPFCAAFHIAGRGERKG